MEKDSDKPPDVYPSDPDEMAVRVQDILDRHRKSEKQLVIAYCRQQHWIGRAMDFFDSMSQKMSAWIQKATASGTNAARK